MLIETGPRSVPMAVEPVSPAADPPATVHWLTTGALAASLPPPDDTAGQCVEAVKTVLESGGERFAVAGSALGIAIGIRQVVEARTRADGEGVWAGVCGIGAGVIGAGIDSGLLAGHPTVVGVCRGVQFALNAAKAQSRPEPYLPGLALRYAAAPSPRQPGQRAGPDRSA